MSVREPGERATAPREGARRSLLHERACAVGQAWAQRVRGELRREQRVIAGGWPGTITEARAHARVCLEGAGANRRGAQSVDELEWVARVTYGRAREEWLAFAEPANDATGT